MSVRWLRLEPVAWSAAWYTACWLESCEIASARSTYSVSYTHLTLPTNREV